ncbi:alpha/beta hydrolase [Cellulomonas shaoxiangyii]|uniref:Alpha/beta fold hydrolase n=1 Tax=Cellulomonas shaoxiangyii TaxID=2566013 RepID=A0A4P7SN11_9CELL|nr:alpha/beta hydrolase [Cellulomonas shaoxiangyii]QCB94274.1 alpha/beta fold hydrolase [Cellulomonas shaoxiangyii]TGY82644.1 alpha/beta fold hydrolase [Cellulomonas shaoxiangyii]
MTIPIVLLHGFPLDHRMWDDVVAQLSSGRTVLAPDLPGPAESLDGVEPTLDAAADRVADAVRAAGAEQAVVAGLSMGGYVALALLERHPDLVAGLALVDTKSTADAPDARAKRLDVAARVEESGSVDAVRGMVDTVLGETTRTAHPELVQRVRAWIDEQPPARVAWSQRAMAARPDRTEVLRRFAGPVVVVVGDEDQVTGVDAAQDLAKTAGGAPLVVVPRAGHLTAVEDPACVAAALAELAQRVDAGA